MRLGWRRVVCQVSGQCQSSAEWHKQVFHTVNICLAAAGWLFVICVSSCPFLSWEALMALFVLPIYVGLYLFQIYKKIEANIYSQTYKMKCTNEKSEILKNYIN